MNQPLVTIITPTYAKPTYLSECGEAVLAQNFDEWVWWIVLNPENERPEYNWDRRYNDLLRFGDPRIMPLIFPVEADERSTCHLPSRIVNWVYPKITTPYIYFLADDDLIDPDGLAALVSAAEENRYDAVYGLCDVHTEKPDGTFEHVTTLHPGASPKPRMADISGHISWDHYDMGLGTGTMPDCLIDGGQVLHTADLWRRATTCSYCNGTGRIIHSPEISSYCDTCDATGRVWQADERAGEEFANHADGHLLDRLASLTTFHFVPQRIVTHRRTRLSRWHKPLESK